MLRVNDHVESFFNSIQFAMTVLAPLESGIRKSAKEFENFWPGSNNEANNLQLVMGEVNVVGDSNGGKDQISSVKKIKGHCRAGNIKLPINTLLPMLSQNCGGNWYKFDVLQLGFEERNGFQEEGTCLLCLQLRKTSNKNKVCPPWCANASKPRVSLEKKRKESKGQPVMVFHDVVLKDKEENNLSLTCLIGSMFDQLAQNLQKCDFGEQKRAVTSILESKRVDIWGYLGNLKFAKVGGLPSSMIGVTSTVKDESGDGLNTTSQEKIGGSSPQKLANMSFIITVLNVENLISTLLAISLAELIEFVPQLGQLTKDQPDKKKVFSVQDFSGYTESAGVQLFEELDRDGDSQVNFEDLEVALRNRNLPQRYAHEFMRSARSHLFSKSIGRKQLFSLMEKKESNIIRAYTSLCLSKLGTLKKSEILASLRNSGFLASEDTAIATMHFLNSDSKESISYGHFRNFMILIPSDQLQKDPQNTRFGAATAEKPAGSVLKSALAGGLSCAFSTALMHPIDTIKANSCTSNYHGFRTGFFEASKIVLINVAPSLADTQVESVLSFCSAVLGTVARVPSEVVKQRLQAGVFDHLGEAIVGTWQQEGLKGFFRGTGATLCREVPFYVAGLGLYTESKKAVQRIIGRELEPWETIAVGAITGGLTAVSTTPFDVIKTRMMISTQGQPVSMYMVAFSILRQDGALGLFKGAVPRFFWVAPLGAINFAGYELARKAMG
ncbi:hypothetical protein LguiA_035056 [Lonicera macranthoides]